MARPRPRRPDNARISARDRRARSGNIKGIVLISLVALIALGLGAVYVYVSQTTVRLDRETMCPVDQPPASITAVLVDASDPLTPVQTEKVRKELDVIRDQLPRHAAFELYLVGDTASGVREPLFKACNPGSPEQISEWREAPILALHKWREGFVGPMEQAFAKAMPTKDSKTSPIAESLQSIAVTAFGDAGLKGVPKHLVVVSDMMQNTARLSHYKGVDYDRFIGTPAAAQLTADLRGVDVLVLYVRREATHRWQGKDHVLFWQSWFSDQGAALSRVVAVPG